ncbi:hypothetical protein ISN45_Aa08g007760 [Arabidopsis thaliana x Arabidopsis arenosa]|uniref:Uncharacterized protein n=1 Tax=Arabidopsis thaliana x Arabidopsis arenosa TaxID=1240361 RepID=A0A8T1XLG9_9BRAS|nr:hypothetical protein ISN45_Aa08g007760 [Arabidopsis thaliana x Arabidopsis arenosa]
MKDIGAGVFIRKLRKHNIVQRVANGWCALVDWSDQMNDAKFVEEVWKVGIESILKTTCHAVLKKSEDEFVAVEEDDADFVIADAVSTDTNWCRPTPVQKSEKSRCDEAKSTCLDTDLQDHLTRILSVARHHLGVDRHPSDTEAESTFDEAESSELDIEESTPDSSVDRHSPIPCPMPQRSKQEIQEERRKDPIAATEKELGTCETTKAAMAKSSAENRYAEMVSIDTTTCVDRHPRRKELDPSNKAAFRAAITAASLRTAVTSTTAPLPLHPPPKQLRYSRSPPKPPDFINKTFKIFKTVSRLSKPRVSRRALVHSFDDCAGKRSIPPIPTSHPADIPDFLGQPHAPTAYIPPWMMRRFSRNYLLPPSDPPDARIPT